MIKLYHGSNVNIDGIGTCYCLSERGKNTKQTTKEYVHKS